VSEQPEASADRTFARMQVGELQIGLPIESVVHALPWPAHLTPLPRLQGGLAGVFVYRELTIPLVSLRQWLGMPDPLPSSGQVLVLRAGTRLVGVGVDAVQGLVQVRADQVVQLHHDDRPEELFHSVARLPGQESTLSLLDPARLMNQTAVWSQAAQASLSEPAGLSVIEGINEPSRPDEENASSAWAVVRTGAIVMACRASDVGEVVPMPSLQRVFGSSSKLLGIARWRDRDLPVARILELLGLGAEQVDDAPWMMVLGHQGRYIGIPVDEVRSVQALAAYQIQSGAQTGLSKPWLFEGLVATEQGQPHVLLNSEAIVAHCPLSDISNVGAGQREQQTSSPAGVIQDGDPAGQAHVVFRAGHAFATPLSGMQEITTYPAGSLRRGGSSPGLCGTFDWRGRACALWDLRTLVGLGETEISASSRVMVAELGGFMVGLLVDELLALLPAHQGEHSHFSFGPNLDIHMISVSQGGMQQSYRVLDLSALPGLQQTAISS
jgi:chemotaxis signal transduction protein